MTENKDTLLSIENLANKFHNPELKKESNVIILYANGEIACTKGGELFGARSEFCFAIAIRKLPIIQLPQPINDTSYAIMTREHADIIRQKLKIICGINESFDIPQHFKCLFDNILDEWKKKIENTKDDGKQEN